MRLAPLFLAVALAGAQLACNSNSTTSAADALNQYCTALTAYDQSVATLQGLGPTATVAQYKEAVKAVDSSFQSLAAARKGLAEAKTDAIQTATDDLKKTVNDIPDSATAAQAVATVLPKVAGVHTTVQASRVGVKCP
jgi:hypothetical protein